MSSLSLPLDRDEYVEQAYLFRVFRERLEDNLPSQEILKTIQEEVLATTKLVHALDFLRGEIQLKGRVHEGMARLSHYFTPFQAFIMQRAEEEKSKFDQSIALQVLERLADYVAGEEVSRPGLFVYQFECVARNRLGYDAGMQAMAEDAAYDDDWRDWILKSRQRLGTLDFAEMIFYRSEHYVDEVRRRTGDPEANPSFAILFGRQEGRIAKANRGRDPLFMFAALQRHLGFPAVPRIEPKRRKSMADPALENRLQRIEQRLQLLESEIQEGGLDLDRFLTHSPEPPSPDAPSETG